MAISILLRSAWVRVTVMYCNSHHMCLLRATVYHPTPAKIALQTTTLSGQPRRSRRSGLRGPAVGRGQRPVYSQSLVRVEVATVVTKHYEQSIVVVSRYIPLKNLVVHKIRATELLRALTSAMVLENRIAPYSHYYSSSLSSLLCPYPTPLISRPPASNQCKSCTMRSNPRATSGNKTLNKMHSVCHTHISFTSALA